MISHQSAEIGGPGDSGGRMAGVIASLIAAAVWQT